MLRFKQVKGGEHVYHMATGNGASSHRATFSHVQDVLFTYRFTEAVCSGGIPVMVTSSQVPPLQDLVPFDTYGVLIRDEEIPGVGKNRVGRMVIFERHPGSQYLLPKNNINKTMSKGFFS